jgi:manganese/zinc/iron transport system permease protein
MDTLFAALVLSAGYNTALVCIGAALLGASAGAIGTFVYLRKRSLVSDAVSHATLPGLVLAFIILALTTGNGRSLPGLMLGSAASAALGLLAIEWMTRRTRLTEDAAIGAVLSVFFGLGIVLLTVVQSMQVGRQAGLSGYLLGSTAGMLRSEAETIAAAGLVAALVIFVLRRPLTLICFDREYAATQGVNVRRTDLMLLGLLLGITVIGLKVVGLVLIVALMIIPPVAARFWTERATTMVLIAAGLGAFAGYVGAAISASAAKLPTGPIIVLVGSGLFVASLILSPARGALAAGLNRRSFVAKVHVRQGLLALSHDERIYDPLTLRLLRRAGYVRSDGVPTEAGRAAAGRARYEEAMWALHRRLYPEEALLQEHQGLVPVEDALPPDIIADLRARLGLTSVEASA